MAFSERELLARLIQCEAGGEGDNGMRAVASVVMNRVNINYGEYARYPTIRSVIFQPDQFTCLKEVVGGQYNPQNIYNMQPEAIHWDIADWAIAGNRLWNTGRALWFFNPYSDYCQPNFPTSVGSFVVRIGDHCFYNPTSAYAST